MLIWVRVVGVGAMGFVFETLFDPHSTIHWYL